MIRPHEINDPQMLAMIERTTQRCRARREHDLQAARDAANASYRPPVIITPYRNPSPPPGGLPSPAASPPRDLPQLQGQQSLPPAVSFSHKPSTPSMYIVSTEDKANLCDFADYYNTTLLPNARSSTVQQYPRTLSCH